MTDSAAGDAGCSTSQGRTTTTNSRPSNEQTTPSEPQPGPSSQIREEVERQNSTTSQRSEAGSREPSQGPQRRFGFLDFDTATGTRRLQALTMIHEWARNNVNANIPMLGSSSSNNSSQNQGAGIGGIQRQMSGGGDRDTHIDIPPGDLPPTSQSNANPIPATPPSANSNSALSLPSRLARGLFPHLRHRSEDIPELPVTYSQATATTSVGSATANGNRETLTLNIEGNNVTSGADRGRRWEERNHEEGEGAEGGGNVPEHETRRGSGDGSHGSGRRESSPAGTPTQGTPGDILRDSPETRAFIEEINQYTTLRPFLIIMILKALVDHGSGIISFLALIVTFSHANSLLKKEISKQRKRNLLYLAMIVVNLLGCTGFIYYIFSDEELYYSIIFMNTKVDLTSFLMLMWVVGVSDYVAKFMAIVAKSFVVAVPSAVVPFQKRGIYYLFIEQTSQLYRSFLPIHPWLLYLITSYEGNMQMFGFFLAGLYTLFKMMDSVQRVKDWNSAFKKLFQNVHYGTAVTDKELDNMDSVICPICHDTFSSPTRLSCSHVFCEECVSTWFDRGMTCPLCRAKVVDDPSFRDGTTAQYIQFF